MAADFSNDGWTDLYVASDSTPSLLLRNKHNSTFSEEGAERGIAFSADGAEQAGMGVAVGDYNLDGNLDIFKTHFSDDTNVLYRNDGAGNFTDVTIPAGFGVETRYICWGTGFADFDNNGWPDLAVVTGSVYPEVEEEFPEYPLKTPRFIFRNLGNGKFEELIEEAGPGISAAHCSRGCAFGDFDNDGDVDMVVINLNEPPSLLRNDLKSDLNWLKVFLVGTKSNRSAIGSRVVAKYGGKVQAQAVMAQSSFYSVNDRRLHFGLGQSTHADLEIHWTNGLVERFAGIERNQLVTIKEGQGISKSPLQGMQRVHRNKDRQRSRNEKAPRQLKPRRPCNTEIQRSERELPAKLQYARIVGRGHLAEVPVVEARIYTVELRVVEGVEGLEPELEFQLLL